MIFQWWTGAVLHTYLRLARYAARHGARLILEWHERQDVGEAAVPALAVTSRPSCLACYPWWMHM